MTTNANIPAATKNDEPKPPKLPDGVSASVDDWQLTIEGDPGLHTVISARYFMPVVGITQRRLNLWARVTGSRTAEVRIGRASENGPVITIEGRGGGGGGGALHIDDD